MNNQIPFVYPRCPCCGGKIKDIADLDEYQKHLIVYVAEVNNAIRTRDAESIQSAWEKFAAGISGNDKS